MRARCHLGKQILWSERFTCAYERRAVSDSDKAVFDQCDYTWPIKLVELLPFRIPRIIPTSHSTHIHVCYPP